MDSDFHNGPVKWTNEVAGGDTTPGNFPAATQDTFNRHPRAILFTPMPESGAAFRIMGTYLAITLFHMDVKFVAW